MHVKPLALLLLWCLCGMATECVVRILHTSDLHANLTGDEIAPTSFAQLATVLQQLRIESPGAVLHIDTGDTIEGSLAGSLCKGRPILDALGAMGCDLWVPGNHEFDFGVQNFLELAANCPVPLLCGNLWARGTPQEQRYPAWKICEVGSARIAVIGLTASYLPNWYLEEFSTAFEVEPAIDTLRRIMPEIHRAKPDAIILGIHQGYATPQSDPRGVNEVSQIAQLFPEIDLILGGHTHRAIPGKALGHVWYLQPAAHGEFIGVAELTIDTTKHQVRQITSRLVQPVAETPANAKVQALLAPYIAASSLKESEIIHAPLSHEVNANGRPGIACPISELICQALASCTQADIALHGTLSAHGFPAGRPIIGADLFAVIPYENTAVVAEVTASELEKIIAEQWSQRQVYTYCGIWGASATIDATGTAHLNGIGEALAPPESNRRYRLVLKSHTAAGGGRTPILRGILSQTSVNCQDTGIFTRDILREWLHTHPEDFEVRPRQWLRIQRK